MLKKIFLGLTLMVLLSGCFTSQKDLQSFPPKTTVEIQSIMDEKVADGFPPGMVVWIEGPEYRFEGASGLANVADNTPMSPDGAFRVGSITKMFTATVIVKLAEDGVLTLDDPVSLWLPEVADQLPNGHQITLHHLLSHTSGLFNVVEHEAYFTDILTEMVIDETTGTQHWLVYNGTRMIHLLVMYTERMHYLSRGHNGTIAIPTTSCSAWSLKRQQRCHSQKHTARTFMNHWK